MEPSCVPLHITVNQAAIVANRFGNEILGDHNGVLNPLSPEWVNFSAGVRHFGIEVLSLGGGFGETPASPEFLQALVGRTVTMNMVLPYQGEEWVITHLFMEDMLDQGYVITDSDVNGYYYIQLARASQVVPNDPNIPQPTYLDAGELLFDIGEQSGEDQERLKPLCTELLEVLMADSIGQKMILTLSQAILVEDAVTEIVGSNRSMDKLKLVESIVGFNERNLQILDGCIPACTNSTESTNEKLNEAKSVSVTTS